MESSPFGTSGAGGGGGVVGGGQWQEGERGGGTKQQGDRGGAVKVVLGPVWRVESQASWRGRPRRSR